MEKENLRDFFKSNGEYSHTRLISIVGSFIVFGVFLFHPLNDGLQNIIFGVLAASMTNATISKFSKINGNQRKRTEPHKEV